MIGVSRRVSFSSPSCEKWHVVCPTPKFSCNRINKSARRRRAPSLARLSVATPVGLLARQDCPLRPRCFEMGPDPTEQLFPRGASRRDRENDLLARINARI